MIGKEVWGYGKESDDQQLGSCTLRFEVGNSVPSDPITTTVPFEAVGLAIQNVLASLFHLGAPTHSFGKSFPGPQRFRRQLGGQWQEWWWWWWWWW